MAEDKLPANWWGRLPGEEVPGSNSGPMRCPVTDVPHTEHRWRSRKHARFYWCEGVPGENQRDGWAVDTERVTRESEAQIARAYGVPPQLISSEAQDEALRELLSYCRERTELASASEGLEAQGLELAYADIDYRLTAILDGES